MSKSKPVQLELSDYLLEHTIAPNIVEHRPTDLIFNEPSLTQQNFAAESDINNILSNWEKNGVVSHLNPLPPQYGDLIDVEDYHSSMNRIVAAREAFDALPSVVRDRFANDPANFLSFVQDPSNVDEMVKLGLASYRSEPGTDVPSSSSSSGARPPQAGAPADGSTLDRALSGLTDYLKSSKLASGEA